VEFLNTSENRDRTIKLLGFADNLGSHEINCSLSEVRANQVSTLLEARGMSVDIVQGYCDDMPVASNETSSGREKNRRVEVWISKK
jgi:phosphate transport system substrate-binding protein